MGKKENKREKRVNKNKKCVTLQTLGVQKDEFMNIKM